MGGASKALALVDGARLIDRVIARVGGQFDFLAINVHALTPEETAPLAPCGLPLIPDTMADRAGPLAGVLAGLDYIAAHLPQVEFLASLPCDCPFLPLDLARRLREAATGGRIACAASGGRLHPIVALWPVAAREKLHRALIEQDCRKVGYFQQTYGVSSVEWPASPDPFFNVNTPDDLFRAKAQLRANSEQ
jgi:molybdopterin-guanine dinucleotide biosynthesis protein A